ncbi:Ig-like domain (group 3), partial [Aquimonas voraii]
SEDSETLGIAKRATATTLASTPADDQQAGQTVTWTVGVSAVGGAATTPLGGEVFVCPSSAPSCDALSAVCTITLPATSCELSYDLPQTVELVARYAGDDNYATSSSGADSISIEKRDSTIAITSDLSAQTPAGAPVTVAFDVDGGHQTYDGTVTVTATLASPAASASCGPVSVDPATGVGSCVIEGAAGFVRAGSWSVVAEYAGDDNDAASSSAAVTHPVGPATTEIVLVSNPDPSRYGEPFALTATVTSSTGIVPTGQVEFFNHLGVSMGFLPLDASGQATMNAPANLPAGLYSGSSSPFRAFKAVFIENADFDTSVDPSETHTIGAADVALTISSDSPTLAAGAANFSVEVSTQSPAQGAPTGTVSLSIVGPAPSTDVAATCSGLALSASGANSSSASCSRVLAAKGSYAVSATYDNVDGNYADTGSASGQITHVVEGVPTSLSLAATVPPAPVYGQSVDIPFTVGGGVTPFLGTVSVSINGAEICAAVGVDPSTGAGACSAYLPVTAGSYSVSAAYSGDIDEASSTATSSFTVAKQTPTVGLSLGPDPVSAGS